MQSIRLLIRKEDKLMDQNSLMGSRLGLLKQVDVLTATHCKGCTISDVKRGLASCKKAECTTLDKFGEIGHLLDVNLNELRLLRNNVQALVSPSIVIFKISSY